jgi:predicted transposase YbfD/YdcC
VAIAQSTYATDNGSEIQALRELLDRVELSGLLVQADALHANRPFSSTSSSVAPTF